MAIESISSKSADRRKTLIPLVLASASPRRSEILDAAGLEFQVIPADVDESSIDASTPPQLSKRLAEVKAQAVAASQRGSCVIGADTVVEFDGRTLGKPVDAADATSILRMLSGQSHLVHTGIAVASGGQLFSDTATTEVRFRKLTDQEIDSYVRTGSPLDKAGAYGIQDKEFSPVASYDGSYLNVVGLPLGLLGKLLHDAGVVSEATAAALREMDR